MGAAVSAMSGHKLSRNRQALGVWRIFSLCFICNIITEAVEN